MSNLFVLYISTWITVCLLAIYLMVRRRDSLELFQRKYWRYLLQGWKVLTFTIAATGLTVIAPYTGDPTWDYIDALFMSVLTFTTAPWAVGTMYRSIVRKVSWDHTYIAGCVWMFSASWSYDLYLVIRDGVYPLTWFANIFLSSVMYLSAGFLWNLEWIESRGVVLGFMEPNWPGPPRIQQFRRIFWFAQPFFVLVAAMVVPFLM